MDDFTATASSQAIDVTPKSVLECLRDAKDQLDEALLRLSRGESLCDETQPGGSDATQDAAFLYDPDDLAAAFFAQQARKQQAEMKLPIYEWARTIHAISLTRAMDEGDATTLTSMVHQNEQKDGLGTADELWNEFKVAYGGRQEM